MPFFDDRKAETGNVEAEMRDALSNAVELYDSARYAETAMSSARIVRTLRGYYGHPSKLLGDVEPPHSTFFCSLDACGRSLRKMWCIDEAELAFSLGIKFALLCPGAHTWAIQYFSRWISTCDRRDILEQDRRDARGVFKRLFRKRPVIVTQPMPGEHPPDAKHLKAIRAILEELGAVPPWEDEILAYLHDCARRGTLPNFERLARHVAAEGWKAP